MKRNRSLEVHSAWGYGITITLIFMGFDPAIGLIVAVGLGALFELIQKYVTRTSGDVWDVIYTSIGGAVAMALGIYLA